MLAPGPFGFRGSGFKRLTLRLVLNGAEDAVDEDLERVVEFDAQRDSPLSATV